MYENNYTLQLYRCTQHLNQKCNEEKKSHDHSSSLREHRYQKNPAPILEQTPNTVVKSKGEGLSSGLVSVVKTVWGRREEDLSEDR